MSDEEVLYMYKMNEILGNPSVSGVTREVTKLMPFLFIGGQHNAESLNTLRTHNITYVLNCGGTPKQQGSPYAGLGIEYYQFNASDDDNYDISQHFQESFSFIEKAKRKGAKILVHCAMGINRSGAVCAAYMMKERRMTLLEILKLLKMNRIVSLTNIGFRYQLMKFARSLGLLDSIKTVKQEIEHSLTKDNVLGGKSSRSKYSEMKPSNNHSAQEQKSWTSPDYTSKYKYLEPIVPSYRAVEPVSRSIRSFNPEGRSRSFQPVLIERSLVNEEHLPTNPPSVYRPVEYEDVAPVSRSRGPIIDPELLDSPLYPAKYDRTSFRPTFSTPISSDLDKTVVLGRRHSLAPSMTHYDNSRYTDRARRRLYYK